MDNCIFCKIVRGEIPCGKVYENDETFAFVEMNPVNPGHTLIIPKRHYPSLSDIPEKELGNLMKDIKKISSGVLKAFNTSSFNLVQSNGEAAGQEVFHVHFHIIPRHEKDNKEIQWKVDNISLEERKKIADKIRQELSEGKDKI